MEMKEVVVYDQEGRPIATFMEPVTSQAKHYGMTCEAGEYKLKFEDPEPPASITIDFRKFV